MAATYATAATLCIEALRSVRGGEGIALASIAGLLCTSSKQSNNKAARMGDPPRHPIRAVRGGKAEALRSYDDSVYRSVARSQDLGQRNR